MLFKIIGFLAFTVGILLAIVAGILNWDNSIVVWSLLVLGILIGLFNVTRRETTTFLMATVALIVVGGVYTPIAAVNRSFPELARVLTLIAALIAPAAIIVAGKAILDIGTPGEKRGFDPQPEPPGRIKGFDPQPEPPGKIRR